MFTRLEREEAFKLAPSGLKYPDDPFFEETNQMFLKPFKKLGVLPNFEIRRNPSNFNQNYYCRESGCGLSFTNASFYKEHYKLCHSFMCAQCSRAFLSLHFLDLHISEQHDSYFAARAARGEFIYKCYVEDCKMKLLTPELRKNHCITVHSFPNTYPFEKFKTRNYKNKSNKTLKESKLEPKPTSTASQKQKPKCEANKSTFTFGHQKKKMFDFKEKTRHLPLNVTNDGKTLENLQDLKEALEN